MNTTTIIITIVAIIGWSMYFYMLWLSLRTPRPPKVSNDAIKISILIFRDFTRLTQGAYIQAKEKGVELYGEGWKLLTEIFSTPVEPVGDRNKHVGSGLSWEMEFTPGGISFITLHGENENLKWEIFSYAGFLITKQMGIKLKMIVG
jgi:hypothetical protein